MRVTHIVIGVGVLGRPSAARPVFKEVAHYFGLDATQAANAGNAASNAIDGLVSAIGSLDEFKPIIHPDVVSTINTIETFGGLISSIVGWVVKLAVRYIYTSDLLNDTPYVGELIRNADSMIKPEYRAVLSSLGAELVPTHTVAPFS
ncbi:hypothetical protein LPJ61_004201 [Coemansia biformis]|uniref:Uncharacterized protein n=1 Tax=Coemansia biformis TaxID=1286918 RepID=A0A9W7YBA8_9FUNG|nr:hypothetical protein LPJ61_004201 [Coemansia biformis]